MFGIVNRKADKEKNMQRVLATRPLVRALLSGMVFCLAVAQAFATLAAQAKAAGVPDVATRLSPPRHFETNHQGVFGGRVVPVDPRLAR